MAPSADRDGAGPSGAHRDGPPLRASDADRYATVAVVQDAVARGLLTPDEGSQRMAAAYAAVHLRDLGPLTEDLPPAPAASTPPGWRSLGTMAVEQLRSSVSGPAPGRLRPARIAVAVALAVLLLVLVGHLAAQLLFDGPHLDGWHGPGPGLYDVP
ncbi:hypothetical protein DQ238_01080 [Geodermatophilus sp. TF02-6]|uniref:DUF1707 SHOCT-like domain-containing protein n=1 Tax=Geodermatophilus sp. TF02-6 TaxID=2250575 RepID=UPI000DE8FA00|nr:DUF1707 domain-containing protein [Geodermatophilus sp. TF02-6]RBY83707.1 hypothetical protein DQ238_01080 [Geodermatophilus sp. TF02-6]